MLEAQEHNMSFESLKFEAPIENPERKRKEERLDSIRADIEQIVDAEGKHIDEGIKESIISFNALEIPTTQSCEGHTKEQKGRPLPWVRVGAEGEPEERFVGQNEAFKKVAKEHNVPLEELKRSDPEELYWEVMRQVVQNEETVEYQEWERKNNELHEKVSELLNEFYTGRETDPDIRLESDEDNGGEFEVHSHEEKMNDLIFNEVSSEEREQVARKLPQRQAEMKAFTDFLKEKYYSE